jgi:hypothetical protein
MNWVHKFGVLFASAALLSTPIATAIAAEGGSQAEYLNYVPSHEGCPGLNWHIDRSDNGDQTMALSGPIWYDGSAGMSFAHGTSQANGSFVLTVTQATANGPTGTITGQRMSDGSIQATAAGSHCFAGTYHLMPGQRSTNQ